MDPELSHSFSPSSVTLIVLLLVLSCRPAEGSFKVIGSPEPIVAAPGDDIILPCHVEPQIDVTGLTVEWSKPDLQPDPNDRLRRVEYVHLYRDAREDLDMKIAEYVQRTELFADGLTRGNISLKITNVTFEDQGRYKCFIPKLKGHFKSSIIYLSVESKSVTTETPLQTPDPKKETDVNAVFAGEALITAVCVGTSVAILLAVVFAVYWRRNRQKQELSVHPDQKATCYRCLAQRAC
ncbi:myelin-oligodendrocyte glycoprotein-like [Acanthopagrus latus]|uniref:myelin-oligodendrocyte glycoprotein-like n=1 Tax=Acanthopagrus latus TaxID=8177 RepID=UPI00187CA514|nr:myelin-oligodendrocyte glycoprotein-like [Acanthopagrus latus]XP_036967722.1 myelin-oligodendrocyte glycoprotein-like [Acanthopagrus latus]XP_036967723.1 myelin-oligodendrocyte glycoprotein-like [Acanthopagrus latus]